ncbi:hypothetical protein GOD54_23425 [Sinorhizobium medicae]|nr:hypothetical protein [Sinorhizobium medicae]
MTDQKFIYGVTTAADRGTIKTLEKTWPAIVNLFRKPVRRSITTAQYNAKSPKDRAFSKNTGLFFGGDCRAEHRGTDDLVARSIVNLDLDDHCEAIWEEFQSTGQLAAFEGLAYLIHSTRSSSPEKPKFRILIPLKKAVSPAEYEPVARGLAEMLDPTMMACARESFTPAQGMYFPSVSSDQEYFFAEVDGDPFDAKPVLKKYPADDASKWPKKPKENVTEYECGRRMTHPEDKKAQAPIIAATHRAFDPHSFIEEFLSDVYFSSGDRYSPHGATGAPSVRVYDGTYIQSDHGSDRAVGQHNTFDLGRIHLFGHLDDDFETSSMSPAEWPSYKAMCEFMLEREEVRDHLADIEDEVEGERNQGVLDMLDELDDEEPEEADAAADDEEDLIGGDSPKKKKAPNTEQVLAKVKRIIAKADSLNDLERRLEKIRAIPTTDFRDLHRDLVAPDVQKKFAEITGEKITKATARKMLAPTIENLRAQAEGQELPAWLKPWVYLSQDNKFLHTDTKELLPKEGFNARFAKEAADYAGSTNLGVAKLSAADLAWSVFEVPKPYTTRYLPGGTGLFEENNSLFANSYRAPSVDSGGYKGSEGVKLLKRLLEDLLPAREHRCMVMDFLAHCVRFPEKKLKYALLIKGAENEGKTLLADLVAKLLGDDNCAVINSDALREKYTGWVHEKLFCVVEEIRIPGREAEEVLNKLKPVITNNFIPIRRMQKDVTRERNFANLYLTTNDEDALRMEVDNTRYLVLFTRFRTNDEVKVWQAHLRETEGKEYARDLWEHIQHRPAQFLEAFAKYKFSEFYDADGRAPMTVFKRIMAEDSKTDERSLLEDLLTNGDVPGISHDVLVWSAFRDILDARDMSPHLKNSAVGKFLKPFGFVKVAPISERIDGKVVCRRVWTRNLSLLDSNNCMTEEGKVRVQEEIAKIEQLDDDDDLAALI